MEPRSNMYKKTAIVKRNMARDLFLAAPGDRIPTIREYTETWNVSRGIVQNALDELERSGCITTEKRGVLGTFLVRSDAARLYAQTGWNAGTGIMPIPLTPSLVSLATAVCETLSASPIEFSFAYMSGAAKRVKALRDGIYDFAILSKSAALMSLEAYPELMICTEFTGARYDLPYLLCFMDPEKSAIEDGMRIGVDPVCLDQKWLTQQLCRDKQVELVEFPFVGFADIVASGRIDCTLFRDGGWNSDWKKLNIRTIPVTQIPGLEFIDTETPVVLVRRDNYAIDRLLNKHLDTVSIAHIQQQVLSGSRSMKFY